MSYMILASAYEPAIGFSQYTFFPASMAAHGRGSVEIIVQANVYRFDVVTLQQVVVIGINVGNLELGRDVLREGFVDVCDGHDLRRRGYSDSFRDVAGPAVLRRSTRYEWVGVLMISSGLLHSC